MYLLDLMFLAALTGTVFSYVHHPNDPFCITWNAPGLRHCIGCRMVYQPIKLYHTHCQYSRQIMLFGCSGYCRTGSNLMYRNPWKVYHLDRKCVTCDANPSKIRKLFIELCAGVTIEIPVPSSCYCRRCGTDLLK